MAQGGGFSYLFFYITEHRDIFVSNKYMKVEYFQQILIYFRPSVAEISEGVKNEGMCHLVVDTNKLNGNEFNVVE